MRQTDDRPIATISLYNGKVVPHPGQVSRRQLRHMQIGTDAPGFGVPDEDGHVLTARRQLKAGLQPKSPRVPDSPQSIWSYAPDGRAQSPKRRRRLWDEYNRQQRSGPGFRTGTSFPRSQTQFGNALLETPFRESVAPAPCKHSPPVDRHIHQPWDSGIIPGAGLAPRHGVIDIAALDRVPIDVLQLLILGRIARGQRRAESANREVV